MLVVDSSVWIDHFRGIDNAPSLALAETLAAGEGKLLMPDLILFEILRGFSLERDVREARRALAELPVAEIGGQANALRAAEHYRSLRRWGRTIRSSVDMLLASWCIEHDHLLLQRDRDFEPYAQHFGLRLWSVNH